MDIQQLRYDYISALYKKQSLRHALSELDELIQHSSGAPDTDQIVNTWQLVADIYQGLIIYRQSNELRALPRSALPMFIQVLQTAQNSLDQLASLALWDQPNIAHNLRVTLNNLVQQRLIDYLHEQKRPGLLDYGIQQAWLSPLDQVFSESTDHKELQEAIAQAKIHNRKALHDAIKNAREFESRNQWPQAERVYIDAKNQAQNEGHTDLAHRMDYLLFQVQWVQKELGWFRSNEWNTEQGRAILLGRIYQYTLVVGRPPHELTSRLIKDMSFSELNETIERELPRNIELAGEILKQVRSDPQWTANDFSQLQKQYDDLQAKIEQAKQRVDKAGKEKSDINQAVEELQTSEHGEQVSIKRRAIAKYFDIIIKETPNIKTIVDWQKIFKYHESLTALLPTIREEYPLTFWSKQLKEDLLITQDLWNQILAGRSNPNMQRATSKLMELEERVASKTGATYDWSVYSVVVKEFKVWIEEYSKRLWEEMSTQELIAEKELAAQARDDYWLADVNIQLFSLQSNPDPNQQYSAKDFKANVWQAIAEAFGHAEHSGWGQALEALLPYQHNLLAQQALLKLFEGWGSALEQNQLTPTVAWLQQLQRLTIQTENTNQIKNFTIGYIQKDTKRRAEDIKGSLVALYNRPIKNWGEIPSRFGEILAELKGCIENLHKLRQEATQQHIDFDEQLHLDPLTDVQKLLSNLDNDLKSQARTTYTWIAAQLNRVEHLADKDKDNHDHRYPFFQSLLTVWQSEWTSDWTREFTRLKTQLERAEIDSRQIRDFEAEYDRLNEAVISIKNTTLQSELTAFKASLDFIKELEQLERDAKTQLQLNRGGGTAKELLIAALRKVISDPLLSLPSLVEFVENDVANDLQKLMEGIDRKQISNKLSNLRTDYKQKITATIAPRQQRAYQLVIGYLDAWEKFYILDVTTTFKAEIRGGSEPSAFEISLEKFSIELASNDDNFIVEGRKEFIDFLTKTLIKRVGTGNHQGDGGTISRYWHDRLYDEIIKEYKKIEEMFKTIGERFANDDLIIALNTSPFIQDPLERLRDKYNEAEKYKAAVADIRDVIAQLKKSVNEATPEEARQKVREQQDLLKDKYSQYADYEQHLDPELQPIHEFEARLRQTQHRHMYQSLEVAYKTLQDAHYTTREVTELKRALTSFEAVQKQSKSSWERAQIGHISETNLHQDFDDLLKRAQELVVEVRTYISKWEQAKQSQELANQAYEKQEMQNALRYYQRAKGFIDEYFLPMEVDPTSKFIDLSELLDNKKAVQQDLQAADHALDLLIRGERVSSDPAQLYRDTNDKISILQQSNLPSKDEAELKLYNLWAETGQIFSRIVRDLNLLDTNLTQSGENAPLPNYLEQQFEDVTVLYQSTSGNPEIFQKARDLQIISNMIQNRLSSLQTRIKTEREIEDLIYKLDACIVSGNFESFNEILRNQHIHHKRVKPSFDKAKDLKRLVENFDRTKQQFDSFIQREDSDENIERSRALLRGLAQMMQDETLKEISRLWNSHVDSSEIFETHSKRYEQEKSARNVLRVLERSLTDAAYKTTTPQLSQMEDLEAAYSSFSITANLYLSDPDLERLHQRIISQRSEVEENYKNLKTELNRFRERIEEARIKVDQISTLAEGIDLYKGLVKDDAIGKYTFLKENCEREYRRYHEISSLIQPIRNDLTSAGSVSFQTMVRHLMPLKNHILRIDSQINPPQILYDMLDNLVTQLASDAQINLQQLSSEIKGHINNRLSSINTFDDLNQLKQRIEEIRSNFKSVKDVIGDGNSITDPRNIVRSFNSLQQGLIEWEKNLVELNIRLDELYLHYYVKTGDIQLAEQMANTSKDFLNYQQTIKEFLAFREKYAVIDQHSSESPDPKINISLLVQWDKRRYQDEIDLVNHLIQIRDRYYSSQSLSIEKRIGLYTQIYQELTRLKERFSSLSMDAKSSVEVEIKQKHENLSVQVELDLRKDVIAHLYELFDDLRSDLRTAQMYLDLLKTIISPDSEVFKDLQKRLIYEENIRQAQQALEFSTLNEGQLKTASSFIDKTTGTRPDNRDFVLQQVINLWDGLLKGDSQLEVMANQIDTSFEEHRSYPEWKRRYDALQDTFKELKKASTQLKISRPEGLYERLESVGAVLMTYKSHFQLKIWQDVFDIWQAQWEEAIVNNPKTHQQWKILQLGKKLGEIIGKDLNNIQQYANQLSGYDSIFDNLFKHEQVLREWIKLFLDQQYPNMRTHKPPTTNVMQVDDLFGQVIEVLNQWHLSASSIGKVQDIVDQVSTLEHLQADAKQLKLQQSEVQELLDEWGWARAQQKLSDVTGSCHRLSVRIAELVQKRRSLEDITNLAGQFEDILFMIEGDA